MPLFMDVHNVDGGVSAADVAGAHEADLATQGPYAVNYLRYWVDQEAALRAELGVAPGPAVQAAMRQPGRAPGEVAGDATIEAIIEAGSAAVSAGAVEAGVQSLRTAARLADSAGATRPLAGVPAVAPGAAR